MNCHSPALLARKMGHIREGMAAMKKTISLLQKIGLTRPRQSESDATLNAFDRRLKMVNRTLVVNPPALGESAFKFRQTAPEA